MTRPARVRSTLHKLGASPTAPPTQEGQQQREPMVRQTSDSKHEEAEHTPTEQSHISIDEPKTRVGIDSQENSSSAGKIARIGIYLGQAEYDDARAGFLACWQNGGPEDSFAKWVAASITAHAERTPEQRATIEPQQRKDRGKGVSRAFKIPGHAKEAMRSALLADQDAGRWLSESMWCREAIHHAVEAARSANGGELPTPPSRLPNRMLRRRS